MAADGIGRKRVYVVVRPRTCVAITPMRWWGPRDTAAHYSKWSRMCSTAGGGDLGGATTTSSAPEELIVNLGVAWTIEYSDQVDDLRAFFGVCGLEGPLAISVL